METNEEKTVGTNLTTVAEFTQTALGLSELKQEFAGVVYNLTNNPAELKIAKAAKKRLTTLRTTLDKSKKDVKADLLERTRKIDGEYNRLLGEIRALEDPIGEQIDKEENRIERERLEALEAEQRRIDGHKAIIQSYRDLPGTLIGMPSIRLEREITKFTAERPIDFSAFEEFGVEAEDAYEACHAKLHRLYADAKASEEQAERQRAQEEELRIMRERNEKLEREATEAREREARREREAEEKAQQAIRDFEEAERRSKEAAERAEREEAQRVENERLQRERDEAQAAAKKAEEERRKSLTVETAARALLERNLREGQGTWQEVIDLGELLAKKTAAKPVKVAR